MYVPRVHTDFACIIQEYVMNLRLTPGLWDASYLPLSAHLRFFKRFLEVSEVCEVGARASSFLRFSFHNGAEALQCGALSVLKLTGSHAAACARMDTKLASQCTCCTVVCAAIYISQALVASVWLDLSHAHAGTYRDRSQTRMAIGMTTITVMMPAVAANEAHSEPSANARASVMPRNSCKRFRVSKSCFLRRMHFVWAA